MEILSRIRVDASFMCEQQQTGKKSWTRKKGLKDVERWNKAAGYLFVTL